MDKRWIIIGCLTIVAFAPGCRSARYRVQRYYKYPPTYTASATNAPKSDVAAKPFPAPNTQQPAPAAQNVGRPAPAATGANTAAPPASVSASGKEQPKARWWVRWFRKRKTQDAPAVARAEKMAAPTNTPSVIAAKGTTESVSTGVYRLKIGDPVVVYLRGIPGVPGGEQQIENVVGEDGSIPLPFVNNVNVLNMTATEAQEAIRRAYVDGQIYKQLTVNVIIPARSYYIRGEVRQPGRYPLVGTVTVLQAIAAAGGYTEFASYGVEIVRGDRRMSLNMRQVEKRPELDMSIEPGDIIVVNRSFF